MAEQGLMLRIGADVVEVTKSLNQVEAEIKQLNQEIKKLSGQDLLNANKRLDQLAQTATALKNVGRTGFDQFGAAINKIGASATGAAPALNSLGQVARDLPFGFIAIQNNLPIVIDQFSALTRASGGVLPALKGLAASLAGPAGIAFAFGAATAGVTALIQKYGSLDAALIALGTSQTKAAQNQERLNNAINDSIVDYEVEADRISRLVQNIANANNSRNAQINAYYELKRVQPSIIGDLTLENALTDDGRVAIQKKAAATLDFINLKGQEQALTKLVADATAEEIKQGRLLVKTVTEQRNIFGKLQDFIIGFGNAQAGAAIRVAALTKESKLGGEEADFYREALARVSDQIAQLDPETVNYADVVKRLKEELAKTAKEQGKIRVGTQTIQASNLVFEFQRVEIAPNNPALNNALREYQKNVIATTPPVEVPLKITVPQQAFDQLRQFGESENLKLLQDRAAAITTQFNEFLAPAINTVFGALENGQSIPKALVQAFKALAVQIAATIAKAVILSAILEATGLGGVAKAAGAVGRGLGAVLNFSGVAAPSFGGISGGGLGLQGQVVFVQRGTDLVGVLNQSNAQIRRVG